ncbi:MAG: hypothetical protein BWY52_02442 [Chloroflexi bacterium ADurb.Bin325]|nr:MAG: hypothetical protein BWY52_02442 [Chloroflexi bacterium ADurb.Bin325]
MPGAAIPAGDIRGRDVPGGREGPAGVEVRPVPGQGKDGAVQPERAKTFGPVFIPRRGRGEARRFVGAADQGEAGGVDAARDALGRQVKAAVGVEQAAQRDPGRGCRVGRCEFRGKFARWLPRGCGGRRGAQRQRGQEDGAQHQMEDRRGCARLHAVLLIMRNCCAEPDGNDRGTYTQQPARRRLPCLAENPEADSRCNCRLPSKAIRHLTKPLAVSGPRHSAAAGPGARDLPTRTVRRNYNSTALRPCQALRNSYGSDNSGWKLEWRHLGRRRGTSGGGGPRSRGDSGRTRILWSGWMDGPAWNRAAWRSTSAQTMSVQPPIRAASSAIMAMGIVYSDGTMNSHGAGCRAGSSHTSPALCSRFWKAGRLAYSVCRAASLAWNSGSRSWKTARSRSLTSNAAA